MEAYETLYQDFIKNYLSGTTTGEDVGELIAKLAGYYPNYNAELVRGERAYALISRDEALKTDEATGKAISTSKSEIIANASAEASQFRQAKMHIQNLEMLIQSAKSLQKGLLQEMSHASLT